MLVLRFSCGFADVVSVVFGLGIILVWICLIFDFGLLICFFFGFCFWFLVVKCFEVLSCRANCRIPILPRRLWPKIVEVFLFYMQDLSPVVLFYLHEYFSDV